MKKPSSREGREGFEFFGVLEYPGRLAVTFQIGDFDPEMPGLQRGRCCRVPRIRFLR